MKDPTDAEAITTRNIGFSLAKQAVFFALYSDCPLKAFSTAWAAAGLSFATMVALQDWRAFDLPNGVVAFAWTLLSFFFVWNGLAIR